MTAAADVELPLPPLIDAHCHLADERLSLHCDNLVSAAQRAGVATLVVNGTCETDWPAVEALCSGRPALRPSYGLHPWRVLDRSDSWLSKLESLLQNNPRACVGEAGLHVGGLSGASLPEQTAVLRDQLRLAVRLGRVVSLHCVGAGALEALHEQLRACAPPGGVYADGLLLHAFHGSADWVPKFTALGAYFSFNATCSLKKAAATWRAVPLDRLLVESDSPDGLPREQSDLLVTLPACGPLSLGTRAGCGCAADHRRLNTPASLPHILSLLAQLRGLPVDALRRQCWTNSVRLFGS